MERRVEVADILKARDERVFRQTRLREKWGLPVISFTMNIAGPIKRNALIDRAFREGVSRVEEILSARRISVAESVCTMVFTGPEKLWAVYGDEREIKKRMVACEEADALGRLFDIDVLSPDGAHLTRQTERICLLCGGPAKICARSRAHPADALFARANGIIRSHFEERFFDRVGQTAERALLHEACVTPKPGLVDAENSGAHADMTLFTFLDSAASLRGYFSECAKLGAQTRNECFEAVFERLRDLGIRAEAEMRRATKGVNTHKGAVFSVGLLCCAAGRAGEGADADAICDLAAKLAAFSLNDLENAFPGAKAPSFRENSPRSANPEIRAGAPRETAPNASDGSGGAFARTGGEVQFAEYGLTGARGEAAAGFPSVKNCALPALKASLAEGKSLNDAALDAFTRLMTRVSDSNVIRRAGMDGQSFVFSRARLVDALPDKTEALRALNDEFVQKNISPGGCADLLAAALFLYFYGEDR